MTAEERLTALEDKVGKRADDDTMLTGAEQLHSIVADAAREARAKALEEAAKVADAERDLARKFLRDSREAGLHGLVDGYIRDSVMADRIGHLLRSLAATKEQG